MKTILIIVIFLLMNAFFIISNNNIKLTDSNSISKFISNYLSWFGKINNNLVSITGEIIKLNWIPDYSENSTNSK